MQESDLKVLRTAVPYIRAYKGKTFVVKLGGEICQAGPVLDNIVEQLSFLYQLGIRLVVVHGAGIQASELADKLGVTTEQVNGRRITSKEMLEVAKMSFAGTVNTDILAAFRKQQVPAVGVSGIDGNLAVARKREPSVVQDLENGDHREIDFGFVGDLVSVDPTLLKHLFDANQVPVISSLVSDADGQVLNINADTLAAALAPRLGAEKYIVLSRIDGVMHDVNDRTSLISELTISEAQELIESGVVQGGMHPKLSTCVEVLKSGIPRAHITNGMEQDAFLKEIFTNEGCGTLITPG